MSDIQRLENYLAAMNERLEGIQAALLTLAIKIDIGNRLNPEWPPAAAQEERATERVLTLWEGLRGE